MCKNIIQKVLSEIFFLATFMFYQLEQSHEITGTKLDTWDLNNLREGFANKVFHGLTNNK